MKAIYLDYNATTPIDPRVAEAMKPFITEHFGNPSSNHVFGITSKRALEKARRQVADLLNGSVEEIIFTSGGSESNNYAIKGIAHAYRHKGNHIITSAIEHPAVFEVCQYLENIGFSVSYVPVSNEGLVDPAQVEAAITEETILISIMHANNEVGSVQPIRKLADIAHKHDVLIHTDAAQSIGKINVTVDALNVDLLSIAGHKLYAPKGIGALYVRRGVKLEKMVHGASHEMGRRAGTENVIEIVGLGKAAELIGPDLSSTTQGLKSLRDHLEAGILKAFPRCRVNGHESQRLPNTSSISFKDMEANTIVSALNETVAVSAGAACHSDQVEVSPVLEAMKVPIDYAMGTVRFSVGRFTTREEIDRALSRIEEVVANLLPREKSFFHPKKDDAIRLTQYTHGLGCACKLRPQLLETILKKMPLPENSNVLVSNNNGDDAAVYKIDNETAIVQTVDFFTPVVDDPWQFGAIAAANALSDIYAMGGQPSFALNIVGFPSNRLPIEVLETILKGAQTMAAKAGVSIIGGHTVDDTEPKFGMAVTGFVHPNNVIRNKGAQAGDELILTKPIGVGILATALKQDLLERQEIQDLYYVMAELNDIAAEAMAKFNVHACTDVTGFGLLGHLYEMMRASKTSARINYASIPVLARAVDLVVAGSVPGGSRDNMEYTAAKVQYDENISNVNKIILNDAQTSGGLLFSIDSGDLTACLKYLHKQGIQAKHIGSVTEQQKHAIQVHP